MPIKPVSGKIKSQEINDNLSYLDAEVVKKMDKNTMNISPTQINKNLGKFDQTYMSKEFLQQIAGNAPVNAVPTEGSIVTKYLADDSVTSNKAGFIRKTVNLFNKYDPGIIEGQEVRGDGSFSSDPDLFTTGYIPIAPQTTYTRNTGRDVAYYDGDRNFLSGVATPNMTDTFTTPANASFLRMGNYLSFLGSAMIVAGNSLPIEYIPYRREIKRDKGNGIFVIANELTDDVDMPDGVVSLDAVKYYNKTANLFNYRNATVGVVINPNTGGLVEDSARFASEYINIKPGTTYQKTVTYWTAFYDKNKELIDAPNSTGTGESVTSPDGAYFARFCGYVASQLKDGAIIEGTEPITDYIPYKYYSYPEVNTEAMWIGNKMLAIGDSYTVMDRYQKPIKEICGFDSITNDGVQGRKFADFMQNVTAEVLADKDVVTIMGGANDFSVLKLGSIDDPMTADTWVGYIKNHIDTIMTLKPSIRLVFITQSRYKAGEGANAFGVTQEDMAEMMKDVCRLYSIPVIDVFSKCGFNQYNQNVYMQADNLHPNNKGFEVVGTITGKELNNL